jgi:hypothetical protein
MSAAQLNEAKFSHMVEVYRRSLEISRLKSEIAKKDMVIVQVRKNLDAIQSGNLARLGEVKAVPGVPAKVAKLFEKCAAMHREAAELRKYDCRKLGINPSQFSRKFNPFHHVQ